MRRSAQEAQRTRDRIVRVAVNQASSVGLSGLTIGSLADALGMSKAGVVGPFGSRGALQSAALTEAVDMFTEAVVTPCLAAAPGRDRLHAVIDAWCAYLAHSPFPNGCFVTAASCELDGQPGELRAHLLRTVTRWRNFLREQIVSAQAAGQLAPDHDVDDLVSTLNGIAMAANQEIQLLGDDSASARARRLMYAALGMAGGERTPHGG
ncbi:TetR/AcrR family transcriptional regulator [Streptomyces cinerochromogenes]|uniref:TetR/AcrR family transcriptional regulator n=1 Tax=Streptomyces cinerochromogenes TaxID=66422 RepID=UPI003677889A